MTEKNLEAEEKQSFTWGYYLWLTLAFPQNALLPLSPVLRVILCQPDIVICWATHLGLLGCVQKLLSIAWLPPIPLSKLRAFVDVDSSSLGHHSFYPWQTLEKIKNPAPLISLEGLQIEFSPSQCPLSWLSLGAEAGPWLRPKDQLTEFEMLWSWQAKGGNWRAVGLLVTFQARITLGIQNPHLYWCRGH